MRVNMKSIILILVLSSLSLNSFSISDYGEAFERIVLELYNTQAHLYHIDDENNDSRLGTLSQ